MRMSESLLINGSSSPNQKSGLLRLPHSKVKVLMKVGDSDVATTSSEATFAIANATEMFIGKKCVTSLYKTM